MTTPEIDSPRGDSWNLHEPCPDCPEHMDHIAQLEAQLAGAKASMLLARAELDTLLVRYALAFARGEGVA